MTNPPTMTATERYLIVCDTTAVGDELVLLDGLHLTAPLDIARLDITLRPKPTFPDADFKLLREKPRRDWEQREKRRRRK